MAADLLAGAVPGNATAVEVVSARRRYGVLAIGEQGGLFNSQSQNTLTTYGRLAAATLDAADAMDQARHQANTAQELLELSTSLSELVSPAEMAAKVARAVPVVIECDCAAVFLDDGDWQKTGDINFRLAACYGFSDEMTAEISSAALPRDAGRPGGRDGDRALLVAGDRNRTDDLGPDPCVGQDHRRGDGRRDGRSRTADHHAADRRPPQGPGRPGLHRHHERSAGGADPLPGRARHADRPAQQGPHPRPHRTDVGPGPAQLCPRRRPFHRSGRLQGGERHARARGRRSTLAGGDRPAGWRHARERQRGTPRR